VPRRSAESRCLRRYLLRSIGIDPVEHYVVARALSATAIAFAATANIIGANVGAAIVGVSTLAKFSALVVLVGASFALGGGPRRELQPPDRRRPPPR
jgi:amino acid transporter